MRPLKTYIFEHRFYNIEVIIKAYNYKYAFKLLKGGVKNHDDFKLISEN